MEFIPERLQSGWGSWGCCIGCWCGVWEYLLGSSQGGLWGEAGAEWGLRSAIWRLVTPPQYSRNCPAIFCNLPTIFAQFFTLGFDAP